MPRAQTTEYRAVPAEIAADLRALGVKPESLASRTDTVFAALVAFWQKHKKPPTLTQLSAACGCSRRSVNRALQVLRAADRLQKCLLLGRKVYVPRMGAKAAGT